MAKVSAKRQKMNRRAERNNGNGPTLSEILKSTPRAPHPSADDHGREIHIGDIVVDDGPTYGRVTEVQGGAVIYRLLDFENPSSDERHVAHAEDLTVVDAAPDRLSDARDFLGPHLDGTKLPAPTLYTNHAIALMLAV